LKQTAEEKSVLIEDDYQVEIRKEEVEQKQFDVD